MTANTSIAPEPTPNNHEIPVNINDNFFAHARAHVGALHLMSNKMGLTLVGKSLNSRRDLDVYLIEDGESRKV